MNTTLCRGHVGRAETAAFKTPNSNRIFENGHGQNCPILESRFGILNMVSAVSARLERVGGLAQFLFRHVGLHRFV
jgi:hypothetical protein